MGLIGGFWLIMMGVLGTLDGFLFKPATDGSRSPGPRVWGIVMLVMAGISALWGAWGLLNSFRFLGFIGGMPVYVLLSFLSPACQTALSIFLILGGVSRLRGSMPGMRVLKLILGVCCIVLGLFGYVAIFLQF